MILRRATITELSEIWRIFEQAIAKRKKELSDQWQNGYPNLEIIVQDIKNEYGFVALINDNIVGYVAIIFDGEPAYEAIKGQWLSKINYAVTHRLAVTQAVPLKGLGTAIMKAVEDIVKQNNIFSIKVDTNYDNIAMLRVFEKLNYTFCGEVTLPTGQRKAFEKLLNFV